MKAMIDEINRQREERRRLVDAECDAQIMMLRKQCEHDFVFWSPQFGHSGWDGYKMGVEHCAKCGAPMP